MCAWATLAVAMVFAGCSQRHATTPNPILEAQGSGTTALLQAVSVVDENIVWVSGHRATYARTVDGGTTWEAGVVPGPIRCNSATCTPSMRKRRTC